MSQPRYFVADTETTDATPQAGVVEVAYLEVDENLAEIDRQHSLIDPEKAISNSASGIHGITYDMVEKAPTLDEFFQVVLQPPLAGDVVLICHRVAFDRQFLEPALNRAGVNVVGQLCTLRLARRYLPKAEDHKLTTLSYQYGLHRGKAHSALDDVLTCWDLLRFVQQLSRKSFLQMVAEEHIPVIVRELTFGKHRGPIEEVPSSYANWALSPRGMPDMDPDLRYTFQLLAEGKLHAELAKQV